ncbi:unnamed protein product [Brassica rapa subsp. trilocularis]
MGSLFARRCETRFVSLDLASSDSLCGFFFPVPIRFVPLKQYQSCCLLFFNIFSLILQASSC